MKLAYGTYGMPGIAPEESLERIAGIGYGGVELAIGEPYRTALTDMGRERRGRLRNMLGDLELALPAIMMPVDVMNENAGAHEQSLEQFRRGAELAADLTEGRKPVLTTTVGGSSASWNDKRDELARRLEDYGCVAEDVGCILAVEPHVFALVDRPERALWLMEKLQHPWVRLNFDVSHFAVQGYPLEDSIPALLPYSVHTHVKDGYMEGEKVTFLLPGEGGFDYVAYFEAMAGAGWDDFVTVEISAQISSREGYDPYKAAEFSFEKLNSALKEAGVAEKR